MKTQQIIEATEATFAQDVQEGTVLVDFWAPWCGPCRLQGTILEEVESSLPDDAKIVKVNVDDAPGIAARFGVRSIPTLAVLRNGQLEARFVGVQQASTLRQALSS